jgi:uncharacterized protein with GYD domain
VLHDFKNPDSILLELDRVIRRGGLLAVIDHKFDEDKVVSVFSNVTENLGLKDMGIRSDSPKRAQDFKNAVEKSGGKVSEIYYTMGKHDFVAILEASNDEL